MLCGDLGGWNGRWDGREVQEGGDYVYIQLIHFALQQKLTQHCEAAILKKENVYIIPVATNSLIHASFHVYEWSCNIYF